MLIIVSVGTCTICHLLTRSLSDFINNRWKYERDLAGLCLLQEPAGKVVKCVDESLVLLLAIEPKRSSVTVAMTGANALSHACFYFT